MAAPAPRPLRGKSFYLDLPSGRGARDLAETIRRLGGVTESFLSKEISYVVSSNKEAKRDRSRTGTEKWNNVTSGDAKAMSLMPSTSKGNHARPHQKPPDKALVSRGKELLQKAMKNQDPWGGSSSILASARLWGVQVLHVDEMLSHAQQLLRAASGARKRCQKTEVRCLASGSKIHQGKLKPPFLKVEDQSRQFRPFHHQFKSFPDLNFLAPKSSSPFEPLKSLSNPGRARGAEGPKRSEGEKSPPSTPVTVPKKKRGFCECCQETFEELQKHLQSPQHKQFALDDSQYAPVDRVISQLTSSLGQQAAKMPWSCLMDEHSVPQAQVTGGTEMLPAELGREREQPEQCVVGLVIDAEQDPGLESRDRVNKPRGGWGLLECCSQGLPVGAGLSRGVCAAGGTTEGSVVGDTDPALAPDLGWGPGVAATPVGEAVAASSELCKQQVLGSISQAQALPAPRKRLLPSSQGTQLGKKPRLELGGSLSLYKQEKQVQGGMGVQGTGQDSEAVVEAGSLPLSTQLSSRPQSSLGLAPCPHGSPGDPAARPGSLPALSVGFGPSEAAGTSTASQPGWDRANLGSQGMQLGGNNGNTPRNVNSPDQEGTVSRTSCAPGWLPSPKLPVAEGRCSCSLCVRAAEKIAPKLPDLPGHSQEQVPCPGLLQPLPHKAQAGRDFSRSSSESDWDVQLLSTLTGIQDSRIQPVDRDLLQRTHVNVRDSGYESQLCSVLKQKSELAWAGKEDKNCWNCCTETKGAAFPMFETFFGSWTS